MSMCMVTIEATRSIASKYSCLFQSQGASVWRCSDSANEYSGDKPSCFFPLLHWYCSIDGGRGVYKELFESREFLYCDISDSFSYRVQRNSLMWCLVVIDAFDSRCTLFELAGTSSVPRYLIFCCDLKERFVLKTPVLRNEEFVLETSLIYTSSLLIFAGLYSWVLWSRPPVKEAVLRRWVRFI